MYVFFFSKHNPNYLYQFVLEYEISTINTFNSHTLFKTNVLLPQHFLISVIFVKDSYNKR
jgi:hypothetical protein